LQEVWQVSTPTSSETASKWKIEIFKGFTEARCPKITGDACKPVERSESDTHCSEWLEHGDRHEGALLEVKKMTCGIACCSGEAGAEWATSAIRCFKLLASMGKAQGRLHGTEKDDEARSQSQNMAEGPVNDPSDSLFRPVGIA
jgi:hypothetical protein